MTTIVLAFTLTLVTAAVLTGRVRQFVLRRSMLDLPNIRSSHTTPTPRGGGLAIVAVTLSALVVGVLTELVSIRLAAALGGGGLVIAAVGWWDDRHGLRPMTRLAVHVAAATWALAWLGGLPSLRFGVTPVSLGLAGSLLGGLVIVWGTNLYNFMDGIDGLAGSEALMAGGSAVLLLNGSPGQLTTVASVLGGASGGFLLWNWPPAKIFMGDVGSGFLGFQFAVLAVASENWGGPPLLAWVLLFGVFIFDATVTLVRRLVRGERVSQAHRRHAYQRAVQAGWSHALVTSAAVALTALLSVLAWIATRAPERLITMLGLGGIMLGIAYWAIERHQPMWIDPIAKSTVRDQ